MKKLALIILSILFVSVYSCAKEHADVGVTCRVEAHNGCRYDLGIYRLDGSIGKEKSVTI